MNKIVFNSKIHFSDDRLKNSIGYAAEKDFTDDCLYFVEMKLSFVSQNQQVFWQQDQNVHCTLVPLENNNLFVIFAST